MVCHSPEPRRSLLYKDKVDSNLPVAPVQRTVLTSSSPWYGSISHTCLSNRLGEPTAAVLVETFGEERPVPPPSHRRAPLTGSPDARMRYNEHDFWKHVIKRFRYKLVGWPESIPFKDLSEVKGGQGPVAELLHLWYKGKLAFVRVESASEVAALKPQTVRTRASRCDLKSHWSQLTASGKPRRCHHRGAITPLTVTEDVDARVDAEVDAMVEGTGGGQRVAQGEIAEDRIESW
ncbi:uncharacterized protein B0H18DRAFT_1015771 [Fomitopsis serialis]|uniref:uncharacterized protein n=1 Tax=Fomitopsis serialis TaxID=139415 RepID=UPI002007929B|nr:uncharacterized protein B0H18DRAFT_1015736 [Neoantrodia serialis]XP_047891725.1 uncharacterized protein B0H18DRAFT_1015771 [Neoantrodia serialis]KAH9923036.1 hypothetical protein B0H18DRAFT_1015736 [Neoantrodia serialis]KAH9923039.1 hypothetical protein B0H18DRAFT_1015771 [Neoantrodia serialis]